LLASYIIRRVITFIPILFIISILSYLIIELPPGDYLTTYIIQLRSQGMEVSQEQILNLTRYYGLDKPIYVRYAKWIWNIIAHGNFGWSFRFNRPVSAVIWERIPLTMTISGLTLLFTYIVAIPIGIFSAVKQYSVFDYVFTFLGFIGFAVPSFLLALLVLWISFRYFGVAVTGLFSPNYAEAPWSLMKVVDMLKRVWVPIFVVGFGGMTGLIRVTRASLLDELHKQYVIVARAKGVPEQKLIFKYPLRVAINPLISSVGWLLPGIVSGESIAAIVLNLPTTGPVLLSALLSQDTYLAGSFILILSFLVLLGNLISDLLLAVLDPRIRFEGVSE